MKETSNGLAGFLALVPRQGERIDWASIQSGAMGPYLQKMSGIPQNPKWHGEGDVLTHTKMVCESLIRTPAWSSLEPSRQQELFLAALLHDIGKTVCTRMEDGTYVSPKHTVIGARMARSILWRDFGVGGTPETQGMRETVCALIRHHSKPFYFWDADDPRHVAIEISSIGELAKDFTNEQLALLVEADICGRIAPDNGKRLEHVDYFRETSSDLGCLDRPFRHPAPFSRYAYLSGRNVALGQEIYDDTWGTVILLAGLPGTGKDTFAANEYPELPTVSLDAIRKDMGIPPSKPQGAVANAALEQAKGYLRKRQPFVWNATNITPLTRKRLVDAFCAYKAKVKIVFLEASWEEMLRRNRNRPDVVAESAIEGMLGKTVLANIGEAHEVEWRCV